MKSVYYTTSGFYEMKCGKWNISMAELIMTVPNRRG